MGTRDNTTCVGIRNQGYGVLVTNSLNELLPTLDDLRAERATDLALCLVILGYLKLDMKLPHLYGSTIELYRMLKTPQIVVFRF